MNKTLLSIIALIAISAISTGVWWFQDGMLKAVKPTRGSAVKAVYASGSVEATTMLPIASKYAARLMKLNVDEGDNVKKGQELADLESTDIEFQIKDLRTKEELAKTEYERALYLYKKEAGTKETLDQASAAYKSAKDQLAALESQEDYTRLFAPDDGAIIKRDGEIGQYIPANQPVFWFASTGDLRITADIDEEDIPIVEVGQKVLIQSDAFEDQVFHGSVQSITQKGDPIARTFRVRITFDKKSPFMIGMNVETNIIISETQNALLIPTAAIKDGYVWTLNDGVLKHQKVKLGAKNLDNTEVVEGLDDSSIVVLPNGEKFTEGEKASVRLK